MRSRVLIVEDDEILRWLLTEVVTHLGHDVIECSSADEALAKLKDHHPLSLVITDVCMPGHHDGLDLAKAIWADRPELPVIIVSAHAVFAPGHLPANARLITKPCTLDLLRRTMDELLPR